MSGPPAANKPQSPLRGRSLGRRPILHAAKNVFGGHQIWTSGPTTGYQFELTSLRRLCADGSALDGDPDQGRGRMAPATGGKTMAVTMTGEATLPAARSKVWALLNDPEVLKTCIPGCQSLEPTSDN